MVFAMSILEGWEIPESWDLRNLPVDPYRRKCLAMFLRNQKETALLLVAPQEIQTR